MKNRTSVRKLWSALSITIFVVFLAYVLLIQIGTKYDFLLFACLFVLLIFPIFVFVMCSIIFIRSLRLVKNKKTNIYIIINLISSSVVEISVILFYLIVYWYIFMFTNY